MIAESPIHLGPSGFLELTDVAFGAGVLGLSGFCPVCLCSAISPERVNSFQEP